MKNDNDATVTHVLLRSLVSKVDAIDGIVRNGLTLKIITIEQNVSTLLARAATEDKMNERTEERKWEIGRMAIGAVIVMVMGLMFGLFGDGIMHRLTRIMSEVPARPIHAPLP